VCKTFINRRYQMLWDMALWTETLGVASQAVAASDEEVSISATPSLTFYQSSSAPVTKIEHPVAIRFTDTDEVDGIHIINEDWLTYFQIDVNAWNNVDSRKTTPKNFIHLPKDSSGNCRIKLIPTPDDAGTLYVLGKLKWVELGDSDSPALNSADNALLSYAEHDMLKRARQYGKAQVMLQEASAHNAIMRDLEKGQRQSISRIIPIETADWRVEDLG
jgi:hypothetical protein